MPELGGFTPVLESVLPWLGVVVPLLLVGALFTRSWQVITAALVPVTVWAFMFGPTLLHSPPGGLSDLAVGTVNVGVDQRPVGGGRTDRRRRPRPAGGAGADAGRPGREAAQRDFPYHYRSARSASGAGTRSRDASRWTSAWTGRGRCGRW